MSSRDSALLSAYLARKDAVAVKALLLNERRVPPRHRAEVWALMLGLDKTADDLTAVNEALETIDVANAPNHRVIAQDVERTRPSQVSTEHQLWLRKALTLFCHECDADYMQGLNEILAPFILLTDPPQPSALAYCLFRRLCERYLPTMFASKEIGPLQFELRVFHELVLYFDPELCIFLDNSQMTPQVYATPWLVTLFSRHTPVQALFALWDSFIVFADDNVMLPLFTVLAFVRYHRDVLLQCHEEHVPEMLSSQLVLETEEDGARAFGWEGSFASWSSGARTSRFREREER
jgi:hypothetical protein